MKKLKIFRKRHIDQQLPSPGMKLSTDIVEINDWMILQNQMVQLLFVRSHKSGIKIHKVKKKYNYKSKTLILKKDQLL